MKSYLVFGTVILVLFTSVAALADCDPPITDRYVIYCCLTGVCAPGLFCPECFWGLPHQSMNVPTDAPALDERHRSVPVLPRFEPLTARYASMCGVIATRAISS